MNKIFLLIAFSIMSLSTDAQKIDSKKILNDINKKTKSFKNYKIEFDFTWENQSLEIKENQKGEITIEDKKFKLKIGDQLIINNGKTQWIYFIDLNEVQIFNNDIEDELMNPSKIFNIAIEEFKHELIDTKTINKQVVYNIDLYPKKSSEFIKINVTIIKNLSQIKELVVYDKNGGTYCYKIKSFKTDVQESFSFDKKKYPNVQVIDLR